MSRTNKDRVADALRSLDLYGVATEGVETALTDLMADMFHLIEREGISFDEVRRRAYAHYSAESGEVPS